MAQNPLLFAAGLVTDAGLLTIHFDYPISLKRYESLMPQRKSSEKSDSTRERIILQAGPIFASKGFRAATVREICDNADVNLASINYYFGDKQGLYFETVVRAREMRVQQVPPPAWDPSTESRDKLRLFVGVILDRLVAMQTEPWQVRLLMREILEPTEACSHLVKEYFRPFFESLLEIVDEIVGTPLTQHCRNKIGLSIVGQCLYYRFAAGVTSLIIGDEEFEENFDRDSLAQHITNFSLAAIENFEQEPSGLSDRK